MEKKVFYAHFDPETGRYQSNRDHLSETAEEAQKRCCTGLSLELLTLTAKLHDCGKYSTAWANYFAASIAGKNDSAKLDHATAGGILAEKLLENPLAGEFVATAIYSHHGLYDSFSFENDVFLVDYRQEKSTTLAVNACMAAFFEDFDKHEIEKLADAAGKSFEQLKNKIKDYIAAYGETHGNRHFIFGMYERLLQSILIDADRRNTEDFMTGGGDGSAVSYDLNALWRDCAANLECRLSEMDSSGKINACRREISQLCLAAADRNENRFILSVPTGAGKTLSSLRFALSCALKRGKKRIIYVAPYMSITEQNAKEIRDAIGRDDVVLEHHSTVVMEDADEEARYDRLTEDWRVPVVVTTAVQFLNTLFSAKTSCVRRLGSLCDSVVIVDEVQALPIKVTELFCAAINFLSEFEGAVFVLCSATQPCFERIERHSLLGTVNMVDGDRFSNTFLRTRLQDDTGTLLDAANAAAYIAEKARIHGDVLFIANTKRCAASIYSQVCAVCGDEFDVSYLSTNLYPEHRRSIIKKLKDNGSARKMRICISTQVVEAGVNLSFRCVIRSLAGLDSIIQAAGRCNRNGEYHTGSVYIVRMNDETEKLTGLPDIRIAQETMTYVLDQYHRYGKPDERLDDKRFIDMYFRAYYRRRQGDLAYHTMVSGISTSIIEMLSDNGDLCPPKKRQQKKRLLCQAFATAGNIFEVIEENGKFSVVVESDKSVPLISEYEEKETGFARKKQLLRSLSSYTVAISDELQKTIGYGIRASVDGAFYVLDRRYYDEKTGVTDTPSLMEEKII